MFDAIEYDPVLPIFGSNSRVKIMILAPAALDSTILKISPEKVQLHSYR